MVSFITLHSSITFFINNKIRIFKNTFFIFYKMNFSFPILTNSFNFLHNLLTTYFTSILSLSDQLKLTLICLTKGHPSSSLLLQINSRLD